MALIHADRVWETSTTEGTGTYSLAGAVAGYRTFVAGIGNANKCYYLATMGDNWEIGLGTVADATPDTLARTRVKSSSNGNAAVSWAAGDKDILAIPIAGFIENAAPPKGHIWGLNGANDPGDTTNDWEIQPGATTDESHEIMMILTSVLTKQINASWAVGDNAGGMNTGAVADNTWYEVMLIYRDDTGVVDAMFTTFANRATLPSGYTHARHIAWIRRGSATNLQVKQKGDRFIYVTPINDVSTTSSATAASRTVTVPPGCIGMFRAACLGNANINAANAVVFSDLDEADTAPTTTNGFCSIGAGDFAIMGTCHFDLHVNSSSQIRDRSITATGSMAYDVSTRGWIDHRRRESA